MRCSYLRILAGNKFNSLAEPTSLITGGHELLLYSKLETIFLFGTSARCLLIKFTISFSSHYTDVCYYSILSNIFHESDVFVFPSFCESNDCFLWRKNNELYNLKCSDQQNLSTILGSAYFLAIYRKSLRILLSYFII